MTDLEKLFKVFGDTDDTSKLSYPQQQKLHQLEASINDALDSSDFPEAMTLIKMYELLVAHYQLANRTNAGE